MMDRPQYVTVNGRCSNVIHTSTGAPQGCVISPILFILYTNDCRCGDNENMMIKYADDTVFVGLSSISDDKYRTSVQGMVSWCEENCLHLNTSKTKEIIMDFRRKQVDHQPLVIKNEAIEMVDEYKYLGTIIDSKLNWKSNTEAVYKKTQQRLHFLRRLRHFHVDVSIMTLFYKTFIQSVITFNFLCWYGSLSVQSKNKLTKSVQMAGKIIGTSVDSVAMLHKTQAVRKLLKIQRDNTHPLSQEFQFLPSKKRLRAPSAKTNRTLNSFVPISIRIFNSM